jgi:phosphoinositide-3-kinase regulatory subunit 4
MKSTIFFDQTKTHLLDVADSEKSYHSLLHQGVLLLVSVICSCIRDIRSEGIAFQAVELFGQFSSYLEDKSKLQQVVPHLVSLMEESSSDLLRAYIIPTLVEILQMVKTCPPSDRNLFPEYILPMLRTSIFKSNTMPPIMVLKAYATYFPILASIADSYLNASTDPVATESLMCSQALDPTAKKAQSKTQLLNMLVEAIKDLFGTSEHPKGKDPEIRINFLSHFHLLAKLFGEFPTNLHLVPLLIRFLREDPTWEVRFFTIKVMLEISQYVGIESVNKLMFPTLIEFLYDIQPHVVCCTLATLREMVPGKLEYYKTNMIKLLQLSTPLLVYPHFSVREGAIRLIATICLSLPVADLHCTALKILQPYLQDELVQISEELLFDVACIPTSYSLYNALLQACFSAPDEFFLTGPFVEYPSLLEQVIQTLSLQKLESTREQSLRLIYPYIRGIRMRTNQKSQSTPTTTTTTPKKPEEKRPARPRSTSVNINQTNIALQAEVTAKQYADFSLKFVPLKTVQWNEITQELLHCNYPSNVSCFHLSEIPVSAWTRNQFSSSTANSLNIPHFLKLVPKPPPRNRSGEQRKFMFTLNEHRAGVNRVKIAAYDEFFVSCSDDKSIRVWETERILTRGSVNSSSYQSVASFSFDQRARCMQIIDQTRSIICGTDRGNALVTQIEPSGISEQACWHVAPGTIQEIIQTGQCEFLLCSQNVIYGIDLRAKLPQFQIPHHPETGYIRSMIYHPQQLWLISGTSRGFYTCWDARIHHPIQQWIQPGPSSPIHRLCLDLSTGPSTEKFFAAVGDSDVYRWDVKTREYDRIFSVRSNPQKPNFDELPAQPSGDLLLDKYLENYGIWKKSVTGESATRSLCSLVRSNVLLAGSADGCVRSWNLTSPKNSNVLLGKNPAYLSYEERRFPSAQIVEELYMMPPRSDIILPISKPRGIFRDTVLDVAQFSQYQAVLSSSRDGTVKVFSSP